MMQLGDQATGTGGAVTAHEGGGLNESNPWGAAAFVLGLVGALLALLVVTFPLSFILGVMAIVFGVIGRRAWIRTAMANAGIVLGLVSVALSIVGALLVVSFVGSAVDRVDQIDEEVQAVLDDAIERLSEELDRLADDTSDRIVGEIDEIGEDLGENIGEGIRDELDAELGEISESISSIDPDR